MTGLVVAVVVIALVVAAVYAAKHTKNPEQAAGHEPAASPGNDDGVAERSSVVERPAGPGAEDPILSEPEPPKT